MPSPHTTRASLIARLLALPGDPGAWADFVATYGPTVVHWCHRHGLQDCDAHDVAQDVLIGFWRHAKDFRYDPARRLRVHLRRMLVSAVSDWSDARRADLLRTGDSAVQALLSNIPARDDLATRIEETFDTELLDLAMSRVQTRVRPRTWQAFWMLALERCSGDEVASRLGMDVNNAYRAKSHVQRLIRETIGELDRSAARHETAR